MDKYGNQDDDDVLTKLLQPGRFYQLLKPMLLSSLHLFVDTTKLKTRASNYHFSIFQSVNNLVLSHGFSTFISCLLTHSTVGWIMKSQVKTRVKPNRLASSVSLCSVSGWKNGTFRDSKLHPPYQKMSCDQCRATVHKNETFALGIKKYFKIKGIIYYFRGII